MSEKFVASNGMVLAPHVDGSVRWEAGFNPKVVTAALREFFLHERDTELGRWRSTVHPSWTGVVDEKQNIVRFRSDDGLREFTVHLETRRYSQWVEQLREVAREYLEAHPESKPWADAGADEVWMFEAVAGLRLGQRALAWRGKDMLWDVIDPKGSLIDRVEDPLDALIGHGFEDFHLLSKASRYAEVVSDDS